MRVVVRASLVPPRRRTPRRLVARASLPPSDCSLLRLLVIELQHIGNTVDELLSHLALHLVLDDLTSLLQYCFVLFLAGVGDIVHCMC